MTANQELEAQINDSIKKEDFDNNLPKLYDKGKLETFFLFLGGNFKKRKSRPIKLHPKGFCNNPDCESCKNSISNE